MNVRRAQLVAFLLSLSLLAAACTPSRSTVAPPAPLGQSPGAPPTLRLGYIPTLTQAAAVVGVHNGSFAQTLGSDVTFTPSVYATGRDEAAALVTGAIDAAYMDPNTAVSAFQASKGGVRIVSGATSRGAFLMTKYYPTKVGSNLRGTRLAVADPGSANDVSLRAWLVSEGLNPAPGGNVTLVTMPYATIVQQYAAGKITGAWVPEQWASRLQIEAGATVFVDESTLWPNSAYASAVLVVRADYLQVFPTVVANLLVAHVNATDEVSGGAASTENEAAAAIKALTGQTLSVADTELSWSHLHFTEDPVASSIATDAAHAQQVGLSGSSSIGGIFDLGPLNAVLAAGGRPTVAAG